MSGSAETPYYSLAELDELAVEADVYMNELPVDADEEAIKARKAEVIDVLDGIAKQYYCGNRVTLVGIYKSELPIEVEGGHRFKSFVLKGEVCSFSHGYAVCDLEEDFDDVDTYEDDQGDLLDEMRSRARGRFAVSHLVVLGSVSGRNDDYTLQSSMTYGAVMPITSGSRLAENEPVDPESRQEEVGRILMTWPPERKELLDTISTQVANEENKLLGLIKAGKPIRELMSLLNEIDCSAVTEHIEHLTLTDYIGHEIHFPNGLPASVFSSSNGTNGIASISPNASEGAVVDGLVFGPHFDVEGDQIRESEEQNLYLHIVLSAGPTRTSVMTPFDLLDGYDLRIH